MGKMISACGVVCSDCPAYLAESKGPAYQRRVAEAWRRIFGLEEVPASISCGGCLGRDDKVFHTSLDCDARRCSRNKGILTCARCSQEDCEDLENAQSGWDSVPRLSSTLAPEDFDTYARPYIGHRERLAAARKKIPRSRSRQPDPGDLDGEPQ